MAKAKPIQISIPNPCSENWDEMTPSKQGKFCAHCQKTVTDFTGWSDAALYEFFAQNKGARICGRVRFDQVDRIIIPHQPQSRLYRLFMGLGLTLVLSQLPIPQTLARAPYNYEYASFFTNDEYPKGYEDSVVISGTVVDEKNEPMLAAIVKVIENDILIGGVATDTSGAFSIMLAPNVNIKACTLVVKYTAYKTRILNLKHAVKTTSIPIKLELNALEGLMIINEVDYKIPLMDKFNPGHNTTIDGSQIEKMPH